MNEQNMYATLRRSFDEIKVDTGTMVPTIADNILHYKMFRIWNFDFIERTEEQNVICSIFFPSAIGNIFKNVSVQHKFLYVEFINGPIKMKNDWKLQAFQLF